MVQISSNLTSFGPLSLVAAATSEKPMGLDQFLAGKHTFIGCVKFPRVKPRYFLDAICEKCMSRWIHKTVACDLQRLWKGAIHQQFAPIPPHLLYPNPYKLHTKNDAAAKSAAVADCAAGLMLSCPRKDAGCISMGSCMHQILLKEKTGAFVLVHNYLYIYIYVHCKYTYVCSMDVKKELKHTCTSESNMCMCINIFIYSNLSIYVNM